MRAPSRDAGFLRRLLLHVILHVLVLLRLVARPLTAAGPDTTAFLSYLIALLLLNHGAQWAGSIVYLCGVWVVGAFTVCLNEGIRSTALVLYVRFRLRQHGSLARVLCSQLRESAC